MKCEAHVHIDPYLAGLVESRSTLFPIILAKCKPRIDQGRKGAADPGEP